jgi:hypothetical protein
MAQACNNIGKEFSLSPPSSSSSSIPSKQRKSNSPQERKKCLKRTAPTSCLSPPTKKMSVPESSSSSMFDSLFYHHLNKTYPSSIFDLSLLSTSPFNYSTFSPSFYRSSYLMDSILSSPFVCNWINSTISDGFCGKRFTNHIHLLEHLYTEHTSIKSSYPSYDSSTSIEKL